MRRYFDPPAAEVARRVSGVRNGTGWLIRCPVPSHGRGHGDRNPSLSLADGANGRLLVKCFAGCDPRDVLAALGIRGGRYEHVVIPLPAPPSLGDADGVVRARRIWSESVPAAGTLVQRYLAARGLEITPPPSLRFHPRLWHSRTSKRLPAMVAGVQDSAGRIVAIHRTWIAGDGSGKADVEPQKAALGPCRGGAVRLAAAVETLQLCEGTETALAVLHATGNPTWACLGTAGLTSVILPETVRRVIICADGDEPGEAAARKAAIRLAAEGHHVRIARPPAGYDFLDVLNGKASAAIRGAA